MFWEVYYYRKPRTDFESVNTSFKGSKRVYGQKKLYCLSASFGIQGLNCPHVLILSSLLILVKNIIFKILLTAAKYFFQKAMKRRKYLLDELKTKNFHQWRSPRPIFKKPQNLFRTWFMRGNSKTRCYYTLYSNFFFFNQFNVIFIWGPKQSMRILNVRYFFQFLIRRKKMKS